MLTTYQNLVVSVFFLITLASCKREEKFPDIGNKIVSPIDVATSDNDEYFFVLNSDFDRTYNSGSLLTLDADGNKVGMIKVPRLGRSITVAGDDMLLTFDTNEGESNAEVWLLDVSDPKAAVFVKSWTLDSAPMNAVMVKDYPYFAVTTLGNQIYVGELKSNRGSSTFKLVRTLDSRRRALYINPERNLLFAFVTDMADQELIDKIVEDAKTVSDDNTEIKEPNEVPDEYEVTKRARNNKARHEQFQFLLYDFAAEAAEDFPERTKLEALERGELRWLYFGTTNFDGTPDDDDLTFGSVFREYRTNFWEAQQDPLDRNSFYISQRGPKESKHANHVVRVTISGDIKGDGETIPKTEDVLSFERVYGFSGELALDGNSNVLHYPGDFEVKLINGKPLLLVNHFRDLVFWKRSEVNFFLSTKIIGENIWFDEIKSTDPKDSYYQVALMSNGKALSCSFYGQTVILLDIQPGIGISKDYKRID